MTEPILAKENKQLIGQLEEEISKLVEKFETDTGLCVTNLDVDTVHYSHGIRFNRVRVDSLTLSCVISL